MAVSIVSSASAASNTVTMPTHAVGDWIVVFAWRGTAATLPTVPASQGWTLCVSQTANTAAGEVYVKRATATDIKELELLLARLRAVQNDLPLWITAHREFHEKISAISRAPRILAQITSLHALIEPLLRVWFETSPESKNVNSVHERILEVMKSGDAEEMEQLIKKHSRVTADVILKSMF